MQKKNRQNELNRTTPIAVRRIWNESLKWKNDVDHDDDVIVPEPKLPQTFSRTRLGPILGAERPTFPLIIARLE